MSLAARIGYHDVTSADGTRVRAWSNDPDRVLDGPTVLLCNGLGTSPFAWPALISPECRVRVVSWLHRGVGGSDRPEDAARSGIDAFVEDALAVLDHEGVRRAPVMGWSMGVNTQFELALRHPDRVSGLFAVAGVPGDTFATMIEPTRLPSPLRRRVMLTLTQAGRALGRPATPIVRNLPVTPATLGLLQRTPLMDAMPDQEAALVAVREFLRTPVDWYAHMALQTALHQRVSLSRIGVPCTLVAGAGDLLAGSRAMRTAAERLPDAEYVELPGTHFLPLESPGRVHELLLGLIERVEAAGGADDATARGGSA